MKKNPSVFSVGQILANRTKALLLVLPLLISLSGARGESILIREAPAKLPLNLPLAHYSPLLGIDYAGLKQGQSYTLTSWLLVPGPWYCASSIWCNRSVTITNLSGSNSNGTAWLPVNTDIYSYGQFDWVFRLYDTNGAQVAWTERYIGATTNRPPVLATIGNQTAVVGQTIHFTLVATDPEAEGIVYGATNLPPGASFNGLTGEFAWTPTTSGTVGPVVFWAQDLGEGTLCDAEAVWFELVCAPNITSQPVSQVAPVGSNVTFAVRATSSTPMAFQWRFNGTNLAGASKAELSLTNVGTNLAGGYSVAISNTAGVSVSRQAVLTVTIPRTSVESIALSLRWLRERMDETHIGFQVYTDISAAGNRFHARGQLPDQNSAVGIFGSDTNQPHSGATCIRCTFTNIAGANFGGFYFLNGYLAEGAPLPYFGEATVAGTSITVTNYTGLNLSGATQLTFWARGEVGGEIIEFFMGGVGRDPATGLPTQPFPDSTPRISVAGTRVQLTTNWQPFAIGLTNANLTNIMGGFGWVANDTYCPQGATFYLDDITCELSATRQAQRLNDARFIRSFRTQSVQPNIEDANLDDDLDLVLRNVAFTYDNALAILAFLAEGSPDSLRRARLVADAFVYALDHDRTFTSGRLRTAYQAGDLALPPGWLVNGRNGTVAIPGFYLENPPRFIEVENADMDTGNNAWGMLALLAAHEQFGGTNYLHAARRIGEFIQTMRVDDGAFPGFRGGIRNAESTNATLRTYASTEHNLDIYAAFSEMQRLTGETQWAPGRSRALQFVDSMWDTNGLCYLTGTTGGTPDSRNQATNQLPVDTQTWGVLAIPGWSARWPSLFHCAEQQHRCQSDGFDGVDFNNDRDGVWFEGSAQLAVAYAFGLDGARAGQLRSTLKAAQQIPAPFGDGYGIPAAAHDGVTSGFSFKLFRRPHLGATCWNIFAQMGFNPYYGEFSPVHMAATRLTVSNGMLVHVFGTPGVNHILQQTSDLVHWSSLATNSSPDGIMEYQVTTGTFPAAFYRAKR